MREFPDTPYSYAEFEQHLYGYLASMDAENEAFNAANGVPVRPNIFRSLAFLRDFMEAHELDPLARTRKSLVIHQVIDYMIDRAEALDIGNHLVKGKTTLVFSNHLVEAIFRTLLPNEVYGGMCFDPDPQAVLRLADELRQRDDSAS